MTGMTDRRKHDRGRRHRSRPAAPPASAQRASLLVRTAAGRSDWQTRAMPDVDGTAQKSRANAALASLSRSIALTADVEPDPGDHAPVNSNGGGVAGDGGMAASGDLVNQPHWSRPVNSGPRPCLFSVGFPLSRLQDRTSTSDLNIRTWHTRGPSRYAVGPTTTGASCHHTRQSANIHTNNNRRQVGPLQAIAPGPPPNTARHSGPP